MTSDAASTCLNTTLLYWLINRQVFFAGDYLKYPSFAAYMIMYTYMRSRADQASTFRDDTWFCNHKALPTIHARCTGGKVIFLSTCTNAQPTFKASIYKNVAKDRQALNAGSSCLP